MRDATSAKEKTELDWRVARNCKENKLEDIMIFENILFLTTVL